METLPWYRHQLRIVQTVLREPDIRNYDARSVVGYLKTVHANCLVVNAGGIVDFFPTQLDGTNPNEFLGSTDMLEEVTLRAHEAGMRVIARVDFRGVVKAVYDRHPDWFARDLDGEPVLTNHTGTVLYTPCYNGYYRNEHAVEYLRMLLHRYPLDGVWHNCVAVWGVCYCPRCLERYKEERGAELGPDAAVSSAYWEWKARCAERNLELMRTTVKEFGDDKAYAAEIFGMFDNRRPRNTGLDLYAARKYFDFLVSVAFLTENSEHPHYEDPCYIPSLVRFLRALDDTLQPVILFGTNGTTHRYVMDPPEDLRVWMWEGASVGSGFWNCLFNGQHPAATHDRRNACLEQQTYAWLERNRERLETLVPVTPVKVFYSKPTRVAHGCDDPHKDRFGTSMRGAAGVLLENHVQFGYCCDVNFGRKSLEGVGLLVLPNVTCISSEHIACIREYVEGGGSLLATFETSLYDERGVQRSDFALGDLFGVRFTGTRTDTSSDSYQLVRQRHEILRGMEDTELLMNAGETALVETRPGSSAEVLCTHVPRIPNQPPEMAWSPEMATGSPTIVVNRFGAGRIVYFANQIDFLCAESGHGDFRDVYRNAVSYLAGPHTVLQTNAPQSVHAALLRDRIGAGRYVLSFVNVTSGPWRPIREVVPVYGITAVLKLRGSRFLGSVSLTGEPGPAVSGTAEDGEVVEVRIALDKLDRFASIAIEVA